MESLKIKGRIWIETESGLKIGIGRARLLEQIDELVSSQKPQKFWKFRIERRGELCGTSTPIRPKKSSSKKQVGNPVEKVHSQITEKKLWKNSKQPRNVL